MDRIWIVFGGKRMLVSANREEKLRIGDTEFQINFTGTEIQINRIGRVVEFAEYKMSSNAAGEPCHCCGGSGRL